MATGGSGTGGGKELAGRLLADSGADGLWPQLNGKQAGGQLPLKQELAGRKHTEGPECPVLEVFFTLL